MNNLWKRGLHEGSIASKIVATVRCSGRPVNAQEIADSLGVQYGTVACEITRLKARGFLGYIEGCPRRYTAGPREP